MAGRSSPATHDGANRPRYPAFPAAQLQFEASPIGPGGDGPPRKQASPTTRLIFSTTGSPDRSQTSTSRRMSDSARPGVTPPPHALREKFMKISYFETGRYVPSPDLPREWPVPPAAYDPATGAEAFRGMVERVQFVEKLGFDWISVSEHHYSPRILTPSPVVSAAWLAARVHQSRSPCSGRSCRPPTRSASPRNWRCSTPSRPAASLSACCAAPPTNTSATTSTPRKRASAPTKAWS